MVTIAPIIALVSPAIWAYLMLGRGGFWLASVHGDDEFAPPAHWPRIAATVPARDEAAMIRQSLPSLLVQDYPGAFEVILIDDQSGDGTATAAMNVAAAMNASARLTV